jgi:hypothetical protein
VIRHDVARTDSPGSVKALIQSDYAAAPQEVRAVFLLGHVPVPYSGIILPDGHLDHRGAWPADVYYGDLDSSWTDTSANNTQASSSRNWNVPGDGKFDTSYLPGDVKLEVGRVDFANLPALGVDEVELLRRYLNKNHAFRHQAFIAERRGYIADNFGAFSGEAFAVNGWRNFAPMFGAAALTTIPSGGWFTTLATNTALWAYGCGGGSFSSVAGVCATSDFAGNDPGAVFTFLFGSYLGDWDSTNNVMRASLATPTYTLAAAWAGRPHWFVHSMALGDTIGYCAKQTQKTSIANYRQTSYGMNGVHVALMGDPTLRLHPFAPPANLAANVGGGSVALSWSASVEPVLGYYVYRADTEAGPFTRLTAQLETGLSFTDASPTADSHAYMVRAVKLETSGSGSYYNASQGAFVTATGIMSVEAGITLPQIIGTLSTNTTSEGTSSSSGGTMTGDAALTGGTTLGGLVSTDTTTTNATTSTAGFTNTATASLPTVTVVAEVSELAETGKGGSFRITRSGDRSARLVVSFSLEGTARNGDDYRRVASEVTIPAGAASAAVTISPIKDRLNEPSETIVLTLEQGRGYLLSRPARATISISEQPANRRK